jgi:hypothetical protein
LATSLAVLTMSPRHSAPLNPDTYCGKTEPILKEVIKDTESQGNTI